MNEKKKIKLLWAINILKFCLPLFSITIYSQIFLTLMKIFDDYKGDLSVSFNIRERNKVLFSYLGPITIIALILLTIIAFVTNILYLKPITDDSNSDILKKFNSFPDIIFLFTKIGINLIFTLDKGVPEELWAILFFLILFSE